MLIHVGFGSGYGGGYGGGPMKTSGYNQKAAGPYGGEPFVISKLLLHLQLVSFCLV